MRALRFLGPGDDGNHVIVETVDGDEQFVLLVDVALLDAARSDLPSVRGSGPEPAAAISPREIQMRVRAGVAPQELAENHDMSLERVLRFAAPVIAERTRIADEARRAKARRSTADGQTVVFGDAVNERFTAHGIDPGTVSWDAYRRDDGQWIVVAGWVGGAADRVAQWAFHLATRTVTALDDTAADLLSDRPIHVVAAVEKPVRPSLVAAPPLAPGVVAFPPMPDALTGPLPSAAELDQVFDQDARDDGPRATGTEDDAAPDPDVDAPPLPLRLADATVPVADAPRRAPARGARAPRVTNLGVAGRDGESDEERAARARIPSWDDILLGVRRKGD